MLPSLDIFLNIHPSAAANPLLSGQESVEPSPVQLVVTQGDKVTVKLFPFSIAPGAALSPAIRLTDQTLLLVGKDSRTFYASGGLLVSSTGFAEAGNADDGYTYSALLDLNTTELGDVFADDQRTFEMLLELRRTDTGGGVAVTQFPVTVRRRVYLSGDAIPVSVTGLQSGIVSNVIVGRTGGGATKLDGVVTLNTLSAGFIVGFVGQFGIEWWQLGTGMDVEDGDTIVWPDDRTSNNFLWRKMG